MDEKKPTPNKSECNFQFTKDKEIKGNQLQKDDKLEGQLIS